MGRPRAEDSRPGVDKIWLRVTMTDKEASAVAFVLRRAAERERDPQLASKMRHIAYKAIELGQGRLHVHRRPVKRPLHDDPEAVARVVKGDAPYPVLSRDDAYRAFLQMQRAGLSAAQMARRLYIDYRSLVRWRQKFRDGEWKVPD